MLFRSFCAIGLDYGLLRCLSTYPQNFTIMDEEIVFEFPMREEKDKKKNPTEFNNLNIFQD